MYKGEWHNGIQHGFGTMIFSDKTFIKGYFKNNVFLNASNIRDKVKKLSLGRPAPGQPQYNLCGNLPVIPKLNPNPSMGYKKYSLMEEIQEQKTISQDSPERKKSIGENRHKNVTFYTDPVGGKIRKFS